MDITTKYLGLDLANPLVASASPLTGKLDTLIQLEEAGAAAVVLPSLFEEQIEHDSWAVHDLYEYTSAISPEAFGAYVPEMDSYNTGPDHYLETLAKAKDNLTIPVIASLNGMSPGGWTKYAKTMQEAGADALELNVYRVATDINMIGSEIEQTYIDLVSDVKASIDIPLAVKISPYFSSLASMCRRLVEAGADGLVLFNRFYQPDINLDELKVKPDVVLSSPVNLRLPLRWTAILRGRVDASIAASSGVHTGEDVVKLLLAGADVTQMTSALLKYGPSHLATVLFEMESWFSEREYTSIEQGKGSLSQASAGDPEGFERTNYMRSLVTYSSRY
ncbi:MAG: dihydroorotate dehydrogenase-like protein [Acidimicrobiia bacterium]|nr:dihydroorotate dehydrogenase-like protein [Acidimicrobiia bacterium]